MYYKFSIIAIRLIVNIKNSHRAKYKGKYEHSRKNKRKMRRK